MMKEERNNDRLVIAVLLIVASVLRFDFIQASSYVIDSDEGIVGLMAKHILDGRGIPVFYYGQHYMGSLEAVLASFSFALFGISNTALKLVPFLFSLGLILLCYEIAHEIWNRSAGRMAALCCAVAPSALIVWSAKARGGFIEILVIGAFALLLTIRWVKSVKPSTAGIIPIALTLGVGWWVNNQILYFMLPAGFAIASRIIYLEDTYPIEKAGKFLSVGIIGLLSFLLGGLPFWIYNIDHNFASFGMFNRATLSEMGTHLTGFFSTSLPILLGARQFWGDSDYFTGASLIVLGFYGFLLLLLFAMRYRDFFRLAIFRLDFEHPVEILVLLLLSCAAIFVYSSFGWLVQAPRYLLPMYVAIFPLAGITLDMLRTNVKFLPRLLLICIVGINVFSSYPGRRAIPGEPFVFKGERVERDHTQLISWLENRGFHWVRTNYWIGYRLAFETKEDVKFILFQEPLESRIDSYEEEGTRFGDDRMPFVLTPGQAEIVKRALERLGFRYDGELVGSYVVLYNLRKPYEDLIPVQTGLHAEASNHPEAAQQGIDGDTSTRWGSAKPQAPGMTYKVLFDEPQTIRALEYCLGFWPQDYPRGMFVNAIRPDGNEYQILSPEDYQAMEYMAFSRGKCNDDFTFYFDPVEVRGVRLIQTGRHAILDWSIAELRFFK